MTKICARRDVCQSDCEKEKQLLIIRLEVSLEGMRRKFETGREGEEGIM